jgi:hypothetical protein
MAKEQVPTRLATIEIIMRSPEFARGLDDVRKGVRYDWRNDSWEYQRDRLFGCIAPVDMPLRIGGKLNPKAVGTFDLSMRSRTTSTSVPTSFNAVSC